MFNKILVFGLVVAVAAAASVLPVKKHEASKDFLVKEKAVLQLFLHVNQPNIIPEHVEIAKNFKIEENLDKYNNVELVQNFLKMWKTGVMMKKDDIFSIFHQEHLEQAIKIFNVMYFAKDFDTFYKTAVWARTHLNQGMFVYTFTVAVLHREDTKAVVLPPLYEIYPHMFVKNDIIQKAYDLKMKNKSDKKVVVIDATHKMTDDEMNKESRVSYFTEDVGLNAYNMYYHLQYPFWMTPEVYNIKVDRRGELFQHAHKQLLNRYVVERMNNNLNDFAPMILNVEQPGYVPNLRYKNGKEMPVRPEAMTFRAIDGKKIQFVQDLEGRIRDAIDMGMVMDRDGKKYSLRGNNGLDILGRMMEETMDNVHPEFYGTLHNHLINLVGRIVDPWNKHHVAPSALEHFETMLRDPMYYRILARIDQLFLRYKAHLPTWTTEQLVLPGVKIDKVEVDKLMTYYDKFDLDITNAVDVNTIEDDDNLEIHARQMRLNHKPFAIRMDVQSDKETTVMARVFITPAKNNNGKELTMQQKQQLVVELDKFPVKLQAGKNTIERKSRDMTDAAADQPSFRTLMKKVEEALEGKTVMYMDETSRHCGFPDRLVLPKGKLYGKSYQIVVMMTPIDNKDMELMNLTNMNGMIMCGMVQNTMYPDKYPMGFPFDREIKETELAQDIPNMFAKEVVIYHKNMDDVNKTRQEMMAEDDMSNMME